MSSFVRVVLFLVSLNVLQASNNTKSENEEKVYLHNTTELVKAMKNEKRKIIQEFETQLERRNKLDRNIQSVPEFWRKRNKLAKSEIKQLLGNSLPLDENEIEANKIILSKKYQEYDKAYDSKEIFPPSLHFLEAKELIEQSDIFKIIKKMPKGANIYCTVLTTVDLEFFYQLTFEDNLYFLFDDQLHFKYSRTKPGSKWRLLSRIRETEHNSDYIEDLNSAIKESLWAVSAETWPKDFKTSQKKLYEFAYLRLSLIKYKPNFIKAFRRALENLYEDNIMYAEINFQFPEMYDLDGKIYEPASVLRFCKIVLDDFKKTHKDFIGVRFYYISERRHIHDINKYREVAEDLWRENPDLMAGLGIIADKRALSDWFEELLKFPKEMKLFINTGFTYNWGVDVDYNILEALILSAESIGEAFTINKHPFIMEELRKRDIPIKFSPFVAQIMNYVKDLRTHPLTVLIATNYPVVIGSLGATIVNATCLSHNWYEAYMAMTPKFCDIRCLKQFAINSWIYSTLPDRDKKRAISAWENQWDIFIEDLIIDWIGKKA